MNRSPHDPQTVAALEAVIRDIGGDPGDLSGQLVREMMTTALRLITDDADTGQRKLVARSLRELRYAMKVFRPYHHLRKVTIFGSARTAPEHPDYQLCVRFAELMAANEWMVITGAGDGIMRAGNEGAGAAMSFGLSIRLPFEVNANEFIRDDPKLVTSRYFFTRKLMFVWQASALALFPGGFGTLDECFEVLTLVQTGKAPMIPIVMVQPPGEDFWHGFDRFIRQNLLTKGMISEEDLSLYHIFDDAQAAAQHVMDFYRNYQAERFVGDRYVIVLKTPLTAAQLDEINSEFGDLVADGKIEQVEAFEAETQHRHLPRLAFVSHRRYYGRLRLLIDRVNRFVD
jgi:uncharacterized protein (TIGR00730 family)